LDEQDLSLSLSGREGNNTAESNKPNKQADAYPTTSRPDSQIGPSKAVIQGFNSSSFPSFPFNSNLKNLLSIKADFLSEALKRVLFAVSSDESRPVFTGVLFQIRPEACGTGFLKLVATDTHRLVCKTLLSGTCNLEPDAIPTKGTGVQDAYEDGLINIIVPGRNLNELTRILNQAPEDEVEISLGDNQIFFIIKSASGEEDEREIYPTCPSGRQEDSLLEEEKSNSLPDRRTILVSRLIAGQFPLYQQVIPQEFKFSVNLKTNELKAAVERAMLFTRENISLVNLSFVGQALDEQDLSVEPVDREGNKTAESNRPDRQADAYPKGLSKCVISAQTEAGGIKEVLTFPSGDLPCPICSIYFNAHYLAEALRAIPTGEVYLNITGPLSAMVMYPVASNPGFQTVVSVDKTTPKEDAYSAYSKQPVTDYLSLLLPARYEE
jgi:DNA polymerase-3 subunit beta